MAQYLPVRGPGESEPGRGIDAGVFAVAGGNAAAAECGGDVSGAGGGLNLRFTIFEVFRR